MQLLNQMSSSSISNSIIKFVNWHVSEQITNKQISPFISAYICIYVMHALISNTVELINVLDNDDDNND